MAIVTLQEAAGRVQDKLTGETIDEFRKSPFLEYMLFDDNKFFNGESIMYSYKKLETMVASHFRKSGENFPSGKSTSKNETVELKPLGNLVKLDRVTLEAISDSVTGVSEMEFQFYNAIESAKMKVVEAFFNANTEKESAGFDGIDAVATKNNRVIQTEDALDLRTDVNDGKFMELVGRLVTSLKAQGAINKFIAFDEDALQFVFDRIAYNRSYIQTSENELGQTIYSFKGAKFIYTGQNSDGNDILGVDPATGTASLFGYAVGQKATLMATAFPEVFRPRIPDLNHMTNAVQDLGVETVLAPVVKDTRSVAKLTNLIVADPLGE